MKNYFYTSALVLLLLVAHVVGDACDECLCYRRNDNLHVDCQGAGLTEIPSNLPEDVHHLLLQGNDLPDLGTTTTLGGTPLENLKVLFVHNNPIQSITAAFFDDCPNVHTLMLHHTELETIPANAFNGMVKMRWLWLNNNALTALPEDSFKDLTEIREIYLFGNSLTTIPNGVFRDQGMIKHLYLHENNIPVEELDCCQFCGVPEPVDVKWGLIEQDEKLRCGYDGTVSCTVAGAPRDCYPVDGKGYTYIFSAAGHSWLFMGLSSVAVIALLNTVLLCVL